MRNPKRSKWQDLNHNKCLQEKCIIHEELFLDDKCPILVESVSQGLVPLNKLNEFQFEVEKHICSLTERSIFLHFEIQNKNLPPHFAIIEKNRHKENLKSSGSLSVKSNPEKPLTLIFSSPKESTTALSAKKVWPNMGLDNQPCVIINGHSQSNGMSHNPHSHLMNGRKMTQTFNGKLTHPCNNSLRSSRSTSRFKNEPCQNGDPHETSSNDPLQNPVNMYAIPNKFWALMEPYCAEITENDVQVLQDMFKIYDSDAEYFKIPPLGTEHNLRGFGFMKTELAENGHSHQNGVNVDKECFKNPVKENDPTLALKKITSLIKEPMDQDSCLSSISEAIMTNLFDDNITKVMEKSKEIVTKNSLELSQFASQPPKQLAKQMHVRNHYKLERNINQISAHLCPLGIALEDEDSLSSLWGNSDAGASSHISGGSSVSHRIVDPEDEVLTRLRHRQSELRLVTEANLATLRHLQCEAKADLQRQEILRRLALADADVIEAYDKLDHYRTVRKLPLKRDKESAWRCIKERKKVIKELESFNLKN